MLNYQTTENTVNLSFSKDYLSSHELARLIETLRVKELLQQSQMTTEEAERLGEEMKENWWQKNQSRFLAKIQ